MNPLRNPVVVGVLAVVAVGVVAYQTFYSRTPAYAAHNDQPAPAPALSSSLSSSSPAPSAVPVPPSPPSSLPQSAPAPVSVMDSNYAQSHLDGWVSSPQRDPFLLAKAGSAATSPLPPWKLKAVWRQSGVTMAAIDHAVYRVGDVLDGYIIININDNEVWLEKNGHKQFLAFAGTDPSAVSSQK